MHPLLTLLKHGDRRSIRGVPEVLARVRRDPALFPVLFSGLSDDDPLVRMRCADALEKLTRNQPRYLAPYQKRLIAMAAVSTQQEVRWHLAQLLARLRLNAPQRRHRDTCATTHTACPGA